MGTIVTQRVWGANAEAAADEVSRELEHLERALSFHSPESDLSRFNANAGRGWTPVSADLLRVLERARACSELTGGSFDVTAAPLVRLWNIHGGEPGRRGRPIPPKCEIERLLPLVDNRDLRVDVHAGSASLARPGQMVDLGAIAKGYAADRAREIYVESGVRSAVVDIGGNVALVGRGPGGLPWRVGIQHPAERQGGLIATLAASDESVVTSGDYERFVESGGARYHHIIDPATGYPARSGLTSATVVCGDSTLADALATAIFVLGPERGAQLVDSFPGIGAVLITDESTRRVYVTDGLRDRFTLLDKRYAIHEI